MTESSSRRHINYIQQDDEFDYLVSLINSIEEGRCVGILLYGPPGVGKTLLASSLAREFKASYYIIDGSPDLDRRDIEGNWELLKGETRFNYGPLTLAIRDANNHGISFVLINEINAIRESEQISLNSLLSENHINLISKGFEKHELNPKNKLVIIGTMNKGVIGINKLQEAFEDRFSVCSEIGYPIKNKEIEIATRVSGCKRSVAEIVVDTARQIRKQAIQDYSLTKIFSTRLIVNFCLVVSRMTPKYLKNNIENIIVNKLGENQEEKKSIAMILDGKMFESKLKTLLTPPKETKIRKLTVKPIRIEVSEDKNNIVKYMKISINDYIRLFGRSNAFKKNGEIMWKCLLWLWKLRRRALQDYIRLTENLEYHEFYKKDTGKSHLYRGNVTLRFIKWLFQQKRTELQIFMKQILPVL